MSGAPGDDRKAQEPTVAQLIERATDQIRQLVRDELALARAELTGKGKSAGFAAAMFGGAGGVALYGGGALVAAFILLVATVMWAWLAALVVAVVLFAVAGLLALSGKKQTERAMPLAPQSTLGSVRKDVESVQQAAKEGRRR
ncbi:phage holin family protein [Micromonospora olivasterospora]|uniref:Putative superfamily III holin-X n=1 Tax=Micromonospora olivasterospora TaxID=1880 RepID=A0A562I2T1_MICOL|nr:phage holin family protein [Micromonospora olivasterospora]TWH65361.1 putative superfamily III holin-X [Micromonospora olivasterospora]